MSLNALYNLREIEQNKYQLLLKNIHHDIHRKPNSTNPTKNNVIKAYRKVEKKFCTLDPPKEIGSHT